MAPSSVTFEPMAFSDLADWDGDDHLAAWKAFVASCKPIVRASAHAASPDRVRSPQALLDVCGRAIAMAQTNAVRTRSEARQFFEANFRPHRIAGGELNVMVPESGSREMAALIGDVNRMAVSLQQLEGARRRWIVQMSHELRTPLSVLLGELESVQDGARQATPALVASLRDEVLQLVRLVNDLHTLSMADLRALLGAAPELADLPASTIEGIAAEAERGEIGAGEPLMTAGGIGRQAFVIATGTATVQVDGATVARLGPGSVVGELAQPGWEPSRATVTADTPMIVVVLGPAALAVIGEVRRTSH